MTTQSTMPWYVFWVCNRTWMESTGHVRQMGKPGLFPQWQPGHPRSRRWQAPVSQSGQPGPVSLPGCSQTIYSSAAFATLTFTVSNGCPRTRPTAPAVARRWYEGGRVPSLGSKSMLEGRRVQAGAGRLHVLRHPPPTPLRRHRYSSCPTPLLYHT